MTHKPLIVIAGPTAVGKTDLSLILAEQFNGEIINGDSLQVYQDLTIGTGKILPEEMNGIPHHLLDILQVDEPFDVTRFIEEALPLIDQILDRGKLPIVVGGTGLYLEGLLYELEYGFKNSADPEVRRHLEQQADEIGKLALWEQLNNIDPKAAQKIPYQNVRRTIRALEVIQVTGKLFSSQSGQQNKSSRFDDLLIVLDRPREQLYERINLRVELMVEAGLEQEAYQLYLKDPTIQFQSTKGIGYKEWWPYFNGQMTKEEVIEQIQQNSRRYAKRQLTWFRNRMKNPQWYTIEENDFNNDDIIARIEQHLKEYSYDINKS